ncbi:hypothetical protein PanWU01x14_135900 [Parasponia andersonii]|uniref:Uncharacterized protein n=1 Tax=Parasponia andersonii TaxID=3476 RepID=A0A2P5CPE1_PARAD|nr:hypothetical protein PanWU01x14_135900 [Parasponia andersonii]
MGLASTLVLLLLYLCLVLLDLENLKKHSKERLPIICFRDGGPPLPDFSRASLRGLVINHYNVSAGNVQYLQTGDKCYPLQKRLTFKMPYGQVGYVLSI